MSGRKYFCEVLFFRCYMFAFSICGPLPQPPPHWFLSSEMASRAQVLSTSRLWLCHVSLDWILISLGLLYVLLKMRLSCLCHRKKQLMYQTWMLWPFYIHIFPSLSLLLHTHKAWVGPSQEAHLHEPLTLLRSWSLEAWSHMGICRVQWREHLPQAPNQTYLIFLLDFLYFLAIIY